MTPAWRRLAVGLAAFQLADAIACAIPLQGITESLDAVGCPQSLRPVLPPIKALSAAGLVTGLRSPRVGRLTSFAITGYFVVAVGFHVRAKDDVTRRIAPVALGATAAVLGAKGFS